MPKDKRALTSDSDHLLVRQVSRQIDLRMCWNEGLVQRVEDPLVVLIVPVWTLGGIDRGHARGKHVGQATATDDAACIR